MQRRNFVNYTKISVPSVPIKQVDTKKRRNVKVAQKPILSQQFRDRFQVDLIDYRSDEAIVKWGDDHKVTFKWLLVVKDHLSRLVYCQPLRAKRADMVSFELDQLFSFIGYPLIFQCDNGKEFQGAVLEMLRTANPMTTTINGRPRTPRDQGSVERANQGIKNIIASMVLQCRSQLKTEEEKAGVTWAHVLGTAMRVMNTLMNRGNNGLMPYRVAFGQDYHEPMYAQLTPKQLTDLSVPATMENRMSIMDSSFKERMKQVGELVRPGLEEDEYNFEDAADDLEKMAFQKDGPPPNFAPNSPIPKKAPAAPKKAPPAPPKSPSPRKQLFPSAVSTKEKTYNISEDCDDTLSKSDNSSDLKVVKVVAPQSVVAVCKSESGRKKSERQKSLSVRDALVRDAEKKNNNKDSISCQLSCTICNKSMPSGYSFWVLQAYHEKVIKHQFAKTDDWWPYPLVRSFLFLVRHRYHSKKTVLLDRDLGLTSNEPVGADVEVTPLSSVVEKGVFLMFTGVHFALASIFIKERKVIIHDGLKNRKSSLFSVGSVYFRAIARILKMYGLVDWQKRGTSFLIDKRPQRHSPPYEFYGRSKNKQDSSTCWTIEYDPAFVQYDSHSCGPLACQKGAELLSEGKLVLSSPVRDTVTKEYQSMLHGDRNNIFFIPQVRLINLASEDMDAIDPSMIDSEEEEEERTPPPPHSQSEQQLISSSTKRKQRQDNENAARKRQRKQAKRMTNLFGKTVDINEGDAVVVKVDKRDRSRQNPLNVVGIVTAVGHEVAKWSHFQWWKSDLRPC